MMESYEAGFDGYLVKPFREEQIKGLSRLMYRPEEELDEILVVEDNLLQAAPWTGDQADQSLNEHYYSRMAELVGLAIEQLASDCFEDVTFDYTNLPSSNLMPQLIALSLGCCIELGLDAKVVGTPEVERTMNGNDAISHVPFFSSLSEAQKVD